MSQQAKNFNNTNQHSKAGQSGIEPLCKKGTLRFGVFFDGTGNDDVIAEEYSNVKKLYDVYKKTEHKEVDDNGSIKFEGYDSAYIRGVGSRSLRDGVKTTGSHVAADYEADGTRASAFGHGGFKRIDHMIFTLQEALDVFKQKLGCYPKVVQFDVFGFSRGAIQARHYVNVLKQGFYQLDGIYDYKPNDFVVTSLNVFDSVSSFHAASVLSPGTPQDFGWAFFINQGWVNNTVHLMANDEFRQNFDGQFIFDRPDKDYPADVVVPKLQELLCLGVHSDIGGGYMKVAHGRDNNDLAKIYLNQMFDLAEANGVSFEAKPTSGAWNIPAHLSNLHDEILGAYKKYTKSKLFIAHKKLRERLAYLYDAGSNKHPAYDHLNTFSSKIQAHKTKIEALNKQLSNIDQSLYSNHQKINDKRIEIIEEQRGITFFQKVQEAYDALEEEIFKHNKTDFKDFVTTWIDFHNTYVHKSHSSVLETNRYDADSQGNRIPIKRDVAGLQQRVNSYQAKETQLSNELSAYRKGRENLFLSRGRANTYQERNVLREKLSQIYALEVEKRKELKEIVEQREHYEEALNAPQEYRKRDKAGMNAEVDTNWSLENHLHRKWYFKKHIDVKAALDNKLTFEHVYNTRMKVFKDNSFQWATPEKFT